MPSRPFAALTVALLFAGAARAETAVADSLEWMTVDARLVVRGKVISHKDTRPKDSSVIYRDLTIEVEELFKGKAPPKHLTVRLRVFEGDGTGIDWNKSKRSYLFFLREGRAADDGELAGKTVLRHWERSAIDLTKPMKAHTADMKRVKDGGAVLLVVRKYARRPALPEVRSPNYFHRQRGFLRIEADLGSEAGSDNFGGSAVYFHVPVEEKHWPLVMAKRRSPRPIDRVFAADWLTGMPGKGAVEVLRELLADPGTFPRFDDKGELVQVEYLVRLAAYDALVARGDRPAKPACVRKPSAEELRQSRMKKPNPGQR